jgi:hypothetical protein
MNNKSPTNKTPSQKSPVNKSPTNKASPLNQSDDIPSSVSKYIFLQQLANIIGFMNEDVDKMTFETKMRHMMRELVEPIIVKSKHDREMIFKLQKSEESF